MKIVAMGAGALGGYFGARLAQAGHEVWLAARGAHLEAMRKKGLRVVSPKGDAHVTNIRATGEPGDAGPAEIELFAVKNRDVETAAEAIRPVLTPATMVVTCRNGITAWERLGGLIGGKHVIPGVARRVSRARSWHPVWSGIRPSWTCCFSGSLTEHARGAVRP